MTPIPSLPRRWRCCRCFIDVNPDQYARTCPCSHDHCDKCAEGSLRLRPIVSSYQPHLSNLRHVTLSSLVEPAQSRSWEDESSQDETRVNQTNVSSDENLDKDKEYESIGPDVQDASQHNPVATIARTTSQMSSLASAPEGLLSIDGMSSKSSILEPEEAGEGFAVVIFQDNTLQELWHEAIEKIPLERFERNLRRMLVRLAKDLMEEARSAKGRRVARFVMSKAASTAKLICEEIDPDSGKSIFKETTLDAEDDSNTDGDELIDLKCFQKLIPNSWAFVTFRANVQRFIRPSQLDRSKHHERQTRDLFSALPFYNPKQVLVLPEDVPIKSSPGGVLKHLNQKMNTWFKSPRREKGMKRVTWTCSCGASLYDDYEELEKGAAKRFQKALRRQFISDNFHQRLQTQNVLAKAFTSVGSLIFWLMTVAYTSFGTIRRSNPSLPSYEPEPQHQHLIQEKPQRSASTEQLYLLLCIGGGAGTSAPKAYQPTVHDVDSDQKLFQKLRDYYTSIRKCWWSWLCLRGLQNIYFVYFDMYDNSLIDIREVNAVPPAEYDTTYRYERSQLRPPIGSNLLMHYFRCPKEACPTAAAPCLRKVPKKINDVLTVCPIRGVSPGWGLHFEEGWCWKRILTGSCCVFVLASLLEGVLYWRLGHSLQDAVAIGSFILACFATAVAAFQAWLIVA